MSKIIKISTSAELLRLSVDEIMSISSDGNYSTIMLDSGEVRVVTMQLGKIADLIQQQIDDDGLFLRIGKSLIVNYNHIFYINPGHQVIELSNRKGFKHSFSASKVALFEIKNYLEKQD